MKVIAKDIEMIAYFKENGSVVPIKFRIEKDNEIEVIKINRIIESKLEKFCGNEVLVFTCNAAIAGREKILEIKYFKEECRWILFKI